VNPLQFGRTNRKHMAASNIPAQDRAMSSGDEKDQQTRRSAIAVATSLTLAGLLSFRAADWFIVIVPQRELLLLLTLLFAVLFHALSTFLGKLFVSDTYLDEFERFILILLDFLAILLFFMGVQYAALILTELFTLYGFPPLSDFLLSVAVLLYLAFNFVPFVRSDLLTLAPNEPAKSSHRAANTDKDENVELDNVHHKDDGEL